MARENGKVRVDSPKGERDNGTARLSRDGSLRAASPSADSGKGNFAHEEEEDDETLTDHEGVAERFMVHDATLYTEVLDSSDWSEVLKRDKRRKKREALAQHSVEEANERDRRDALRKKAADDAKAVREARKKLLSAAKEERDTLAFRERNDEFFVRHNDLLAQWEPIERTSQSYHDRVREQIYRRWEKEVFIPTQKEINRKVEAKCATDTRPHLFDKGAKRAMEALKGNEGNSSSSCNVHATPLSWKEKKDELWKSFLNESNRKSKMGGRAGLFLDVIDEVEYNPIAQRKADTIKYKKRTLPTSDADQHRLEAQKLELQYSVLGLAYRDQERKSCTGILRENHKPAGGGGAPNGSPRSAEGPSVTLDGLPCSTSNNRFVRADARSYSTEEENGGGNSSRPSQFPPSPPVYHLQSHDDHSIPHTHVPYDFAKQYHSRTQPASRFSPSSTGAVAHTGTTPRGSRMLSGPLSSEQDPHSGPGTSAASPQDSATSKNLCGNSVSSRRRRAKTQPSTSVDRSLALASITGEGAASKSIKETATTWKRLVDDQRAEERRCQLEDRHQSPLAIAAQQQRGEQNILECDRLVMPLPLKPSPAPPTESSKHLLPWMCPTNGASKIPINERSHYLPVKQWAKAPLLESVYGHYVYPDGSLRPPQENKKEGGFRIHDSNVSFDHFNFPKENEATKTGKRMCVYYQM